MEKNNKSKSTINLGIQFLRFLLCFWIVIVHCSIVKKEHKKYLDKRFHVPTFFLISFYFYYTTISTKNKDKVIFRFQRLLLPYLFWPFVQLILKIKILKKEEILKNIFMQLLIGSPIHSIFWFQFNLLFVSLFFTIILFAFKKNGIKIMLYNELICYYLHLTSFAFKLLDNYQYFFKNNIGGLLELLPLAVNGSILKLINIELIFDKFSVFYNFCLLLLLFLLFDKDIFLDKPGFRYPNVSLNIISSLVLFLFFGALPLAKIKNNSYN